MQVSHLDWSQVRQAAWMPRSLARSTICFPAVGAFIGGTCATGYYTGNIGGSFASLNPIGQSHPGGDSLNVAQGLGEMTASLAAAASHHGSFVHSDTPSNIF